MNYQYLTIPYPEPNLQAPMSRFLWLDHQFIAAKADDSTSEEKIIKHQIGKLTPFMQKYLDMVDIILETNPTQPQYHKVSSTIQNQSSFKVLLRITQRDMLASQHLIKLGENQEDQIKSTSNLEDHQFLLPQQQDSNISALPLRLTCPVMGCTNQFNNYQCIDAHLFHHCGLNMSSAANKEEEKTQFVSVNLPSLSSLPQPANKPFKSGTRYRCTFQDCNKSFSRKSRLKAHLHLHFGSQPFRCPYESCGKAFSERPNLIIHTRIHTNERPYYCGICQKRFTTKGNMKDHERRHLKQKPFECEKCKQTFYRKNILSRHLAKCQERQGPAPIDFQMQSGEYQLYQQTPQPHSGILQLQAQERDTLGFQNQYQSILPNSQSIQGQDLNVHATQIQHLQPGSFFLVPLNPQPSLQSQITFGKQPYLQIMPQQQQSVQILQNPSYINSFYQNNQQVPYLGEQNFMSAQPNFLNQPQGSSNNMNPFQNRDFSQTFLNQPQVQLYLPLHRKP